MRSVCCGLFFLHMLAAGGYPGQAKSGHPRESPPRESPPLDVNLMVRTHNGQSVFQIGEMIELELLFTSTSPKKYLVSTSTFDRPDHIAVEPLSGWYDPLSIFFRLCPVLFDGGLVGTQALSPKPTIVGLLLNEWVRFKDPGEYQITVQSGRAGRKNAKRVLSLTSNRLSLRIVSATAQWQERTLRSALAVLDATGSATDLSWTQRRHDRRQPRSCGI